jgi:hypothetical protein
MVVNDLEIAEKAKSGLLSGKTVNRMPSKG